MALGHSPSIVTNGLVSYWDAANTNRSARGYKNLLDLSTWTLGTGSTATYAMNGTVAENQRILDTGPFGVSTLVWDSPSNDATSDADGGFQSPYISIDSSQLYRFSVWLRRKNIGDGSYYVGTYGINAGLGNDGVLLRANTQAVSTNPYFSAGGWPASIANNEWMLVVGHIFPANSGSGSVHADSGLWNTSGTKFQAPNQGDWVWKPTNTLTIHRAYLYYSTITTTNQQFYQPRIDLCDGSQPTIAELIAGVGSKWYDMIGSNHGSVLKSVDPHNSAGYMTFDGNLGANSCVVSTTTVSFGNNATWEAWVNCTQSVNTYNMFMGRLLPYFSFYVGNSLLFSINIGGTQKTLSTSTNLTTNTWYHAAFTTSYDGANTTMKIYVNGNETASASYAGAQADASYPYKFMIGDGNDGSNGAAPWYPFKGSVSNVKIYNRTLAATEVKQNFNALKGRFGI